jgi:hypothetical protein
MRYSVNRNEVVEMISKIVTIDWTLWESVQATLRSNKVRTANRVIRQKSRRKPLELLSDRLPFSAEIGLK